MTPTGHPAPAWFDISRRIRGLRLVATDGPFNTGSGPLVSGTTLALTMSMTGRRAYCDALQGDGAATLLERCEAP